jgi:hypothetical protein
MSTRLLVLSFLALSASTLAGCGSEAGAPAPPVVAPPAVDVTQTGRVLDFATKQPVAGATISAGGQTAITDATGAYSFKVRSGLPFTMSVTGSNRASMFFQERSLDADVDDGSVLSVDEPTANLLRGALDGYDRSLGSISTKVIVTGACASNEGATVSVSPAGAAKIVYFRNGLPSASQTSIATNELPSAVIYNLQPGVPVTLSVLHPSCKQIPFPVKQGNVEYTGALRVEAGDVTTYASLFVQ